MSSVQILGSFNFGFEHEKAADADQTGTLDIQDCALCFDKAEGSLDLWAKAGNLYTTNIYVDSQIYHRLINV